MVRGRLLLLVLVTVAALAAALAPASGQAAPAGRSSVPIPSTSLGPCGPGQEAVVADDGRVACTHGPDGRMQPRSQPAPASSPGTPTTAAVSDAECYGTGSDGRRVQVLYARASDVPDAYASSLAEIRNLAAEIDDIVLASAQETGGFQKLRWVTDSGTAGCAVVVGNVVLGATADDSFANTLTALRNAGYDDPDRKYLVFMDADVICGQAELYQDAEAAQTNDNNGGPTGDPTAGMIGRVDRGTPGSTCWDGSTATHELFHTLGAVQSGAPHSTGVGHCTDDYDLMCYVDTSGLPMQVACADVAHDDLLDCGHDDYYDTSPTGYLANSWNTADSSWVLNLAQPGDTTPPSATSAAPTNLGANAAVTFGEYAYRLSGSNVVLRTQSGSTVTKSLACRNGAGHAVDCAVGPVKSAVLAPSSGWVPGERYQIVLNPSGPVLLADLADNAMATTTVSFRAPLVAQENAVVGAPTWRTAPASAALGGSYVVSGDKGASASYTVSASSWSWFTSWGPDRGKADVYVDGAKAATLDLYRSSTVHQVRYDFSWGSSGPHVLKIVVTGARNSRSKGTLVPFDGMKVGSTTYKTPRLSHTWAGVSTSKASGGRLARERLAKATFTMPFRGTRVDWYTVTGPSQGKADVYIDGVKRLTIDNYSASSKFNVRRSITGLSDARHTLKIVVLGTRRAAATGTYISVDRIVVA